MNWNAVNNMVTAGAPLRAISAGGAGGLSDLSQLHGGIELQTAAVLNDSFLLQSGGTNINLPFNVTEDVYYVVDFYLPSVANILTYVALWFDANNYLGIRLNTGVDGNFYFVTRLAAAETTTSLGAAATTWYRAYIYAGAASCWCVLNGANAVVHTANIPTDNLSVFIRIETLDGAPALKTMRTREILVLQDAP